MQDLTGVPAVVDLAGMRDAIVSLGGRPVGINPLVPVDLVIDHSVIIERSGTPASFGENVDVEYERNLERYQLLEVGTGGVPELPRRPPGTGICHQVNLEYLSQVVIERDGAAFPDTLVGIDSHTTMVNGLAVLGWGVGGIEAEAAVLGQPHPDARPAGRRPPADRQAPEGVTATDVVLTITELLRRHGVVDKFVEAFGPGVAALSLETRATIGNMSPEYGSTCTIFPIDQVTLDVPALHRPARATRSRSSRRTRKSPGPLARPRRARAHLLRGRRARPLDASSRRWPVRPGPRTASALTVPSSQWRATRSAASPSASPPRAPRRPSRRRRRHRGDHELHEHLQPRGHGGRRARRQARRRAGARGQALGQDLARAGLAGGHRLPRASPAPRAARPARLLPRGLRVHDVHRELWAAVRGRLRGGRGGGLSVAAVLSGNRNFESRIHPDVRQNYLASPPLVVAYALAGTVDVDLATEPLGTGSDGQPVFLRDVWPSDAEVADAVRASLTPIQFTERYAEVFTGGARWDAVAGADRRDLRLGRRLDLRAAPSVLRRARSRAGARARRRGRPGARSGSGTRSRRTTSLPPVPSGPVSRRASTSSSTGSRRRTSTPTARAAATTR